MKKRWMQVIACLLPVAAMAQEKAQIRGTVGNDLPTTIYTICHSPSSGTKSFDSAVVKDRKFTLNVPVDGLSVSVMMYAGHTGKGIQQSEMHDSKGFLMDKNGTEIFIKDSLKTAVLSHNKLEDEKAIFTKYTYQPAADSAKMGFYINGAFPILMKMNLPAPPDSTDKQKFADYQRVVHNLQLLDDFAQKKLALMSKYIKENPDAYFSLQAVAEISRNGKTPGEAEELFKTLSERLRNSGEGLATLAEIKKPKTSDDAVTPPRQPLATGVAAPDFTQYDVNGKAVKLSDFKGKYVLLDFWASWCVPCRKENPNVVKAYNQFKDRNFTVIGIALEEKGKKDAWLAAIKKDGLPYLQLADLEKADNPAAKAFGVSGIPYSFLIDPSGRIIASNLRGEQLFDKLTEVLAN